MLGFSEENLRRYREAIQQPYGIMLRCGPAGSGKSMTLYSALNEINLPELVIRTAEAPFKYTLADIKRMQMHRQIRRTFASALRALLRQDPGIVLVGEIRDKETRSHRGRGGAHGTLDDLDPATTPGACAHGENQLLAAARRA